MPDWRKINTGVPQGSVLEPLFFIFINNLSDGITSTCKFFADEIVFSHNVYISAKELNSDLEKISKWALQWKMQHKATSFLFFG